MKFARTTLAALAAGAMALGLAGCGNNSGVDANGNVTLEFFANNTEDVYKPLLTGFQKKNPKIKIKFSTTTGAQAGYQQTLQTRISGGRLPDVFIAPPEQLPALVKAHAVKDLTSESFMDRIGDTNKAQSSVDGKVWTMSISSWSNAMAYNKDLLAKAGYDRLPETWDEFLDMLVKLKQAGVKEPYLEPKGGLGAPVEGWLGAESKGQSQTIDQQISDKKTTFEKAYSPLYAKWEELIKRGVMGSNVTGLGDDQVRTEFVNGRLAVMPSGYWDVNTFNGAKNLNYSFGLYPKLKASDESYAPGSADSGYAISAKLSGEKLKAAEKFLDYISSPEGLKTAQDALGSIPSTKNFTPQLDEKFKEPYEQYIKKGNIYLNSIGWDITGRSTLRGATYSELAQVALGKESPVQAGKNLDAKLATLR